MAPGAPAAKKRPKSVKLAKVVGQAIEWIDLEDDVTSVLGTDVSIAKERVTGELPSSKARDSVSGVTPVTGDKPKEQSGVTPAASSGTAPYGGGRRRRHSRKKATPNR